MEQGYVDAVARAAGEQSALRALRQSGWIPAVVYGGDEAVMPISVSERTLAGAVGAARKFVQLTVAGQPVTAMIHDVQRDPLTKRITHADFYRVDLYRETDVEVPIHLHGVELAQKRGCIVQQQLRTLSVRALPSDTPEYISVDVSALAAGQHLTAGDILLPGTVHLKSDPTEVLVSALAPSQVVVLEDETSPSAAQE